MKDTKIFYTAIFGDYDNLHDKAPEEGWRFICFTDQDIQKEGWEIIRKKNFPKFCRYLKIRPDLYLPKHDVSVWADGSIGVKCSLEELIQGKNYCVMEHPYRDNIASEAAAVISGLIECDTAAIKAQLKDYEAEGFNIKQSGLAATGFMIRRNTKKNREFAELWSQQVWKYSIRDQLSFPYCVWKLGLKYETIPWLYCLEWERHKKDNWRRG